MSNKNKNIYVLDMFPYPSGEGLHVGHPKGYIATDIYSRFKKMNGYNVVHPMGWDAFGLPAEQFALKNKTHPKVQTEKNVANFKKQLEKINLDYDWDREISTTDPKFYKWTQWIFKQLYKKGLAYESFEPINWCPSCKTGLANEDLEGNACERCSTIVEKKPLRQWNLAITKYADRLIDDLDTLTLWPEWVKTAQKNWIGRSEGSEIEFKVVGGEKNISFKESAIGGLVGYGTSVDMSANYSYESKFQIFTTRADTLFGCTYTVLAPEHRLVREFLDKNIINNKEEVEKYLEDVKSKTDLERSAEGREKTGVRLEGVMAINPANNKEVPIYIADYVLASYGTGAIMAVPAHDERDYEFAKKYGIEIVDVIGPVFEDKTETSKWRDDKPVKNRNVVMGIIKDINTGKYCVLNWKLNGWKTFISGMIEEGESEEEALRREILEETGLDNVINLRRIGLNFSKYFIPHKDFNNSTTNVIYYGEVEASSAKIIDETESAKHEVMWVEKDELLRFFEESEEYQDISYLKYGLARLDGKLFTGDGKVYSGSEFDGMTSDEARKAITLHVGGKLVTKYKLREWVFARQRYWGEPFPIVFDEDHKSYVVADTELPILLPDVESYEPTGTGESPLANIKSFTDVYGYINDDGEFESVKECFKFEDKFIDDIVNEIKTNTVRLDYKDFKINDLVSVRNSEDEVVCYVKLKNIQKIKLEDLDINNPNGTSYNSKEEQIESYKKYYGEEVNLDSLFFVFDFEKFNKEIKLFRRETNTMPQWAGSSWYYLRFLDPNNNEALIDPSIERAYRGLNEDGSEGGTVDLYVGGDHATRHLIYARFWHKFLYDIGVVSTLEPFKRLEFLGFILAEDGRKMSKRWGNIINPDDIVAEYGSDTLRVYEMFMAPFEATAVWNTSSIKGVKRFLERVAKLKEKVASLPFGEGQGGDAFLSCSNESIIHQTIKKVTNDIENFKFNTCVSQLMICLNEFEEKGYSQGEYDKFMTLLFPFAPTLAAEYKDHKWPEWDENKLESSIATIALQINGKMRGTFDIVLNASDEEVTAHIKTLDIYKKYVVDVSGQVAEPKKIIIVKNKIVNVVV